MFLLSVLDCGPRLSLFLTMTRRTNLQRTLSGWLLALGVSSWATGRRRVARFAFDLLAYGGAGAIYGHTLGRLGVSLEPAHLRRTPKNDLRGAVKSLAWHVAPAVVFHVLDNRHGRR